MKKCPFCAEEIQEEAVKCRFCGEWLHESGQAEIEDPPEVLSFDLMLVHPGNRKIQVIKEIRNLKRLGLKESKDLVDASADAPQLVLRRLSQGEADQATLMLNGAGATVEVLPSSDPPFGAGGQVSQADSMWGTLQGWTGRPQMLCPHCQQVGRVATKQERVKKGISGGKATAALLTAGVSMLATGLSRKEGVTTALCSNCGVNWQL